MLLPTYLFYILNRTSAAAVNQNLAERVMLPPSPHTPSNSMNQSNSNVIGEEKEAEDSMLILHLHVTGMSCVSCVQKVEKRLSNVNGVVFVVVSLPLCRVEVKGDRTTLSIDKVVNALLDMGYGVEVLPPDVPNAEEKEKFNNVDIEMTISGMSCVSCATKIEKALSKVKGVESATVSLPMNNLVVSYSPEDIGVNEISSAVLKLGYGVEIVPVIKKEGGSRVSEAQDRVNKAASEERKTVMLHLVFALIFTIPLFVITMGHMFGGNDEMTSGGLSREIVPGLDVNSVLQLALATPVQFGPGLLFARRAWQDVVSRQLGMNFLIFTGTMSAYLYSCIMMVLGVVDETPRSMNLFFETSAILISFVLLGKLLELIARAKASGAVRKLMQIRATNAVLITDWPEAVKEEIVPTDDLRPGDVVMVKRGSKVPADCKVLRGLTHMNESMLTGESMPVSKVPGSKLISVTVCVEGLAFARVIKVGDDTVFSQIIYMIQRAQGSKPPIQKIGDTIAGVFVPTVVAIAVVTFSLWLILSHTGTVPASWRHDVPGSPSPSLFSFMFGLSVLVISCPCAVGLATPVALMVGCGVAASNGVLAKGGEALESASHLDTIVFDKTGTITEGKPRVMEFVALLCSESIHMKYLTAKRIVVLAASAERSSEHPLGRAIVDFAVENGLERDILPVKDGSFIATSGKGLKCVIGSESVAIGSPSFIGISTEAPQKVHDILHSLEERGRTAICIAIDGHLVGIIGISDSIKHEAPEVVKTLMKRGFCVFMITGDNSRTALSVGRECGIPENNIISEVLPKDKASKIEMMQNDGHKVAMVGDGINDAPALTQSNVGIAIGAGTDIAIESADIVLMRSHLFDVITVLSVSTSILLRIKLNYTWALGYNSLGIPIAAGAIFPFTKEMIPPELAGAAMVLSSVSVVLSSLLLFLYRKPKHVQRMEQDKIKYEYGLKNTELLNNALEDEASRSTGLTNVITLDLDCYCECYPSDTLQYFKGVSLVEVDKPLVNGDSDMEGGNPAMEHCGMCSHGTESTCNCKNTWCSCCA